MPVVRQYRVRYRHASLGWSPYSDPVTANAVPVAGGTSYSLAEDGTLNVSAPGLLAFASDYDEDSLTANLVTDVSNGTLTLNTDGSFTYTPSANFNGSDSFTYRVYDGAVYSSPATVSLTITAVNDPPVGVDDPSYSVVQNNTLIVAAPGVLQNDTDVEGSPLTAVLVTDVSNGTLSLSSDGSFSYTPNVNFTGTDTFVYAPNDGVIDGGDATVTITVTEIPTTQNDRASTITYRSGGLILFPPLADGDLTIQADRQHLSRRSYRKSLVTPQSLSLLQFSNLTYQGSFIPTGTYSGVTADFAGIGIGFNQQNNSLIMSGKNVYDWGIMEFEIPASLGDANTLSPAGLPSAIHLQSRTYTPSDIVSYGLNSDASPGGHIAYAGNIYTTISEFYDADVNANASHIAWTSNTFSSATLNGLYKIGSLHPGYVSTYILEIPSSYRSRFGNYTHASGKAGGPIVTASGNGPGFIAFNVADLTGSYATPLSSANIMYYPNSNRLGGEQDAIYNACSRVSGGAVLDGTNCAMFFGDSASFGAKGYIQTGYGVESAFNDSNRGGSGFHSLNGDYSFVLWWYNLDDLEAAFNGSILPWELQPYHWEFINLPLQRGATESGGVAYDPANKRIFLAEAKAGSVSEYANYSLIHVFTHP